jgi:hypothetical protein
MLTVERLKVTKLALRGDLFTGLRATLESFKGASLKKTAKEVKTRHDIVAPALDRTDTSVDHHGGFLLMERCRYGQD